MPEEQSSRLCAQCGVDISHKRPNAKYCGRRCADVAKYQKNIEKERKRSREYKRKRFLTDPQFKEKDRNRAREYMRKRLLADPEFKARQADAIKRWKQNNPQQVKKHRVNETRRCYKYEAHVKDWLRLGFGPEKQKKLKRKSNKHDWHVNAWRNHLQENPGAAARYWKQVGQPWRNGHLSRAKRYVIRYRLDIEFRLNEINRQTWRKDTLSKRNDSTIDFGELLRERKTCPYCACKITKDNAVADHMDPVALGGANSQQNLTICCKSCNTKKSGKPFAQWLEELPAERRSAALSWYTRKHKNVPEQASLCFTFAA